MICKSTLQKSFPFLHKFLTFHPKYCHSTSIKMAEAVGAAAADTGGGGGVGGGDIDMKYPVKEEVVSAAAVDPAKGPAAEEKNPYAYLNRDEFTSEIFKIEVRNLPKFYGFKELKKLLNNKLKLNSHKIKIGGSGGGSSGLGSGFMFVSFKTELEKQKAIEALNGFTWKNKTLKAEPARAVEDPLIRKRVIDQVDKCVEGFVGKDESIEDTMKRVTIPWWNITYEEQLKKKMQSMDIIACDMTKKILEINPTFRQNFKVSKICPIDEIKPSPVTEKYRNKCEFTMGYHPETKEKVVGFRVSSYKEGSIAVGPIQNLDHLPSEMIAAATAFQDYIRASEMEPFNPENHAGVWKQLTVRTNANGEIMMILVISDRECTGENLTTLTESLKQYFSTLDNPKVTSFFLKTMEAHGQQQRNVSELLLGSEYITESLLGLNFRISSDAFFQVNVPATEVLYTTIGSLLESNPNTTVLDVCCGTGTIGISIANKCGQVLGIEMVESAVKDARLNAERNGLSEKCTFFAGRAEDVIDAVIREAKFENIVAIVDPPRSGLHQRVVLLLRKCEKIKKLIYVSCDARLATKNFVDLARPVSKTYHRNPFLPVRMIPIDMFPHCHHTEVVILFERQ